MKNQELIEAALHKIYEESREFFRLIERKTDYGFKIFNAPPIYRTPILFIGYQPGGDEVAAQDEINRGSHLTWPEKAEYATASWKLAREMRSMLGSEIDLNRCVGINAIFLRAPDVKKYKEDVNKKARADVKNFCKEQVVKIVSLVNPLNVIAIGFETLRLFGETKPDLTSLTSVTSGGRPRELTCQGRIGKNKALGVLHLSGFRISRDDRARIANRIISYANTPGGAQ